VSGRCLCFLDGSCGVVRQPESSSYHVFQSIQWQPNWWGGVYDEILWRFLSLSFIFHSLEIHEGLTRIQFRIQFVFISNVVFFFVICVDFNTFLNLFVFQFYFRLFYFIWFLIQFDHHFFINIFYIIFLIYFFILFY
jgi:hypothetical protein